jgi:hypothetical protein
LESEVVETGVRRPGLDGVGRMRVGRRGFGRTWFGTCNLWVGKSGGRRAAVGELRLWRRGFGDRGWTGLAG